MRLSRLIGDRFKEKPADATIISQILLMRGGYIKHVGNGIYTLLTPAKRITDKIEKIIRQEMDAIDGQEVLMPVVLPRELWEESGRYASVGSELLRFKDRSGRDMLLAMTHEEAAVHMARDSVNSHSKMPVMFYQLQTKFRDEARPKGGLIRVKEFTMKDAYSFHSSQSCLEEYYKRCYDAYFKIFTRIGIPEVIAVGSDTGMMGGSVAHEFMLLSDAGEDNIVVCGACDYKDNIEVANSVVPKNDADDAQLQQIHTPGTTDIESLCKLTGKHSSQVIKACAFVTPDDKTVLVFIRGDYDVNESKLKKIIQKEVFPLDAQEHLQSGIEFGYIGPHNLDKSSCDYILFDISLKDCKDMVCGANKPGYHYTGAQAGRDFEPESYVNIYKVNSGDKCANCGGVLTVSKGIEVGNIFQLGTKYSKSMNMTYLDKDGERKHPIMGCYGIGVGRALASVVEAKHDDKGPIWPVSIAPWHVHICVLSGAEDMCSAAEALYNSLNEIGVEVIIDDRGFSAGVQFSDADLLGVPYRIIFGNRNYAQGNAEIISRDKSFSELCGIDTLQTRIVEILKENNVKI